eukprot:TRINITY_DN65024_c0_g1_i1.p1 TRINITY_DN65024_c0_g1~~TRINITY_DN65024_c0_g1_i1.p1  ORF type:complete len:312 (-),score=72.06 TRINITY_DN65024_c0_g1_i1:137-1072(-)
MAPAIVPHIPLAQVPRAPPEAKFCFCPSPRKPRIDPAAASSSAVPAPAPDDTGSCVSAPRDSKVKVLKEVLEPGYEPAQDEIEEYAAWLGIDLEAERHLLWIAESGLKAACPEPWKPCQTEDGELFYFNFKTGDSLWDHPCDVYHKKLYQEHRAKSRSTPSKVPSLFLGGIHQDASAACDLVRSPRKLTARVKAGAEARAEEQVVPAADGKTKYTVKVLEEEMPSEEPAQDLIDEYAQWLGMDLETDQDLLWIARAGLMEPCPENWKPCMTEEHGIFYFNFETGESIWDHPCDQQFRDLFKKEKAQRQASA